jgi:hypothetical protein
MRTKTNTRAIALAGKSAKSGRSLISGLLFGLSAASLLLANKLPRPKVPMEGLASDWDAIGGDLRNVLDRHGA